MIGVGLPWDAGVFIQEYWSQGVPGYAIANSGTGAVTLSLAEWNAGAGQVVLGGWEVPARSVRFHNAAGLGDPSPGTLLAVVRDGEGVMGLLRWPRAVDPPPEAVPGVVTVEGLNGLGARASGPYCVQPRHVFRPGTAAMLRFYVPGDAGVLQWGEPQPPSGFPTVAVESVRCGTLSVQDTGSRFVVGERRLADAPYHDIAVAVRLPNTPFTTMAALVGRVRSPAGAAFAFARGLVVEPPEL